MAHHRIDHSDNDADYYGWKYCEPPLATADRSLGEHRDVVEVERIDQQVADHIDGIACGNLTCYPVEEDEMSCIEQCGGDSP